MKREFLSGAATALSLFLAVTAMAVPQSDIVGYWTHELRPGFNLVAFPVLPDTPTPQAVIGGQLGEVEISMWDEALDGWRSARFDPDAQLWSGNLFLLNRGVGYWINLPHSRDVRRLTIVGRPEVYTRFDWERLSFGRHFYAPIYGKPQAINDIPPQEPRDLLISWDSRNRRFDLAESAGDTWRSLFFDRFEADRAYIVDLHRRPPRQLGPELPIQFQYERLVGDQPARRRDHWEGELGSPPKPLIVGNIEGLAVCNRDGDACSAELSVTVYREHPSLVEGLPPRIEELSAHRVSADPVRPGRFRIAAAVGEGERLASVGDRLFLVARDGSGAETRSTSFEVPEGDEEIVDLSFNEPLAASGSAGDLPTEFSMGKPFPNPFNDRFSIDFRLPEAASVEQALYDVSGRMVWNRVSPFRAGSHRLTLQPEGISSGVYLLKLKAGRFEGTAKAAYLR